MKNILFVLLMLMQVNCAAEYMILNFWEDKSLKQRHHCEIPLSFENYSNVFKAMFEEADDDLVKVDEYMEKLPFTVETMTDLIFLTNYLYRQGLRNSSDIDLVIDSDLSKTLDLLEAARFFNLNIIVDLLNNIINQACCDIKYLQANQQAKFYNDMSVYFSSYDSISKIWLLSEKWERKWYISEKKKQEQDEQSEKKKISFYLGYRPRVYSIFTLILREVIKKHRETSEDSFSASKS